jgi:hypothetical protein
MLLIGQRQKSRASSAGRRACSSREEETLMTTPRKFLIEGLDRVGKDRLIAGIQDRLGYHPVIHCSKPFPSAHYARPSTGDALRLFQEDTFMTMFSILGNASVPRVIYNRAHLGECVYAPLYRGYSGDYVFSLESIFRASLLTDVRLVLLTENLDSSRHFLDDGESLGPTDQRKTEQDLFIQAFKSSTFADTRMVNVTDANTGAFRAADAILDEVLA